MENEDAKVTPISEYWQQILDSGETIYAGLIYRIPPRLWRPLMQVQKQLKAIDPRHLFQNPGNFHVPVKGLGYLGEDVDRDRYEGIIAKIQNIISQFPPFEIKISGIGVFPTGVYARVDDGDRFKQINNKIADELAGEVDRSRYDAESFVPHVTIATFNARDVSPLLDRVNSKEMQECDFGSAGVFEIEMVRTNLILALGPEETQGGAFSYIRSFWLSGGKFVN